MIHFSMMLACLSLNIYHEARSEPDAGMYAVAYVTMNRVKERHKNVCQVVFEPYQFSWANDALDENLKLLPQYQPHPRDPLWIKSQIIARAVLTTQKGDNTRGATYYHADYVKPKWARQKTFVIKYGHHIFYR